MKPFDLVVDVANRAVAGIKTAIMNIPKALLKAVGFGLSSTGELESTELLQMNGTVEAESRQNKIYRLLLYEISHDDSTHFDELMSLIQDEESMELITHSPTTPEHKEVKDPVHSDKLAQFDQMQKHVEDDAVVAEQANLSHARDTSSSKAFDTLVQDDAGLPFGFKLERLDYDLEFARGNLYATVGIKAQVLRQNFDEKLGPIKLSVVGIAKAIFNKAFAIFRDLVNQVWKGAQKLLDKALAKVKHAQNFAEDLLNKLWAKVKDGAGLVVKFIKEGWNHMKNGVKQGAKKAWKYLKFGAKRVWNFAKKGWNHAKRGAKKLYCTLFCGRRRRGWRL